MRMDPVVKELWIEALESGEYKQGYGSLAHTDPDGTMTYCCLGVLCDLAAKRGIVEAVPGPLDMGFSTYLRYGSSNTLLPPEVSNWAGIAGEDVAVDVHPDVYGGRAFLGSLNDSRNFDFHQIAQLIREQL